MHQNPNFASWQSNSKMHTRLEASEKREDLKIITEGKTEEKNYARRQIKRTDDYKKYTALHCLL